MIGWNWIRSGQLGQSFLRSKQLDLFDSNSAFRLQKMLTLPTLTVLPCNHHHQHTQHQNSEAVNMKIGLIDLRYRWLGGGGVRKGGGCWGGGGGANPQKMSSFTQNINGKKCKNNWYYKNNNYESKCKFHALYQLSRVLLYTFLKKHCPKSQQLCTLLRGARRDKS